MQRDNRNKNNSEFTLLKISEDKRVDIYNRLPIKTLGYLLFTCTLTNSEVKKFIPSSFKDKLFDSIIFALHETFPLNLFKLAAENILNLFPELLFEKKEAIDAPGRHVKGSVYQIAWATGDVWMIKMMNNIIPRIENGIEIAKQQYKEQFPNANSWYDERNKLQIKQIQDLMGEIVPAIFNDPCTDGQATQQATTDVIKKLNKLLTPNPNEVITTGLHSPPEIFKIIYATYITCAHQWTIEQRALFSCKVMGPALKFAATVDVQRYRRGLRNYIDESTPPSRYKRHFCDDKQYASSLGETWFLDVADGMSSPVPTTASRVLMPASMEKNYPGMLCDAKEPALKELVPDLLEINLQKTKTPSNKS